MRPLYDKYNMQLYCGDCFEVLSNLKTSINAIITSPPYANQRKMVYASISEEKYPEYTLEYCELIRKNLAEDGNIFIVIRPHLRKGQISDYVLKTRMKMRTKWVECDELIWIKTDSPPLGSIKRPRRAWESILWFGKTGDTYCNPRPSQLISNRIGFENSKHPEGGNSFIHAGQNNAREGIARDPDYIAVGTSQIESGLDHPALYPVEIPRWLALMGTRENDTVLDPFAGLCTTGIACLLMGRRFIGIEVSETYCNAAIERFERKIVEIGKPTPIIEKEKGKKSKLDRFLV